MDVVDIFLIIAAWQVFLFAVLLFFESVHPRVWFIFRHITLTKRTEK